MCSLFPPRVGVGDEGNNGNKNPPRADPFPLFPSFQGHTRDGNKPGMRPLPRLLNLTRTRETFMTKEYEMNDKTTALIPGGLPIWLAPHAEEVAQWRGTSPARECWVADCRRDAHLHGLCKTHIRRAQRAWNPRPADVPKGRATKYAGVGPASDNEAGSKP